MKQILLAGAALLLLTGCVNRSFEVGRAEQYLVARGYKDLRIKPMEARDGGWVCRDEYAFAIAWSTKEGQGGILCMTRASEHIRPLTYAGPPA